MRLTRIQRENIHNTVEAIFGKKASVYLFGSRVNDKLKGGDIDLLIEANFTEKALNKMKILTLVELKKKLGDQKIDIIAYNKNSNKQAIIIEEAKKTGILI